MEEFHKILDLDKVEKSSMKKLWLEIIRDSLHKPIPVPITVVKGAQPGPVVGITAALHGDEINGIGVLHRFLEKVNPKNIKGTLVCVHVANVPGYRKKIRAFTDRVDLNHIMPGKKNGNTAEVYAYQLFNKVIKQFDYLLDLHTASKGRQNTLYIRADMDNKLVARMAKLIGPEIILHNPPNDKTLRGAASKAGIPSITIEVGNPSRFQERYIKKTVTGIRALLCDIGVLIAPPPAKSAERPIRCRNSKWIYTDSGGILEVKVDLGEKIKKGDLIATIRNIFGDLVIEYRCPFDGIVIGRSFDPVAESGARIIHLGLRDGK